MADVETLLEELGNATAAAAAVFVGSSADLLAVSSSRTTGTRAPAKAPAKAASTKAVASANTSVGTAAAWGREGNSSPVAPQRAARAAAAPHGSHSGRASPHLHAPRSPRAEAARAAPQSAGRLCDDAASRHAGFSRVPPPLRSDTARQFFPTGLGRLASPAEAGGVPVPAAAAAAPPPGQHLGLSPPAGRSFSAGTRRPRALGTDRRDDSVLGDSGDSGTLHEVTAPPVALELVSTSSRYLFSLYLSTSSSSSSSSYFFSFFFS